MLTLKLPARAPCSRRAQRRCSPIRSPRITQSPPARMRSRTVRSAAGATPLTQSQVDRGHGPHGWLGAGWAIDKNTLTPKLRELLVTYGELAQATYDELGTDRCNTTDYGFALQPPEELLHYLSADYPLASFAHASPPGTRDKYYLPPATPVTSDEKLAYTLSPIIHALAGKGELPQRARHWPLVDALFDWAFVTTSKLLVTFVDAGNGSRPLFQVDPATGRGVQKRGAFMGYVAVSTPIVPDDELDVALVWRGTIFKEEWESNFAQDDMTKWDDEVRRKADSLTSARDDSSAFNPREVGVHSGFDDLYNRRVAQPGDGQLVSPREVVREWLLHLMKTHNVTTITTTGHSLGGSLSTLSAFGVGWLLAHEWDRLDKTDWKTKVPPRVTNVSFGAPRVGNYAFVSKFRELGVRALRVVNIKDIVPKVPGVGVQFMSQVLAAVPFFGRQADTDMDSLPVRVATWLYHVVTVIISPVWPDRWGYFHVGQVLQLDTNSDEQVAISGPFQYHNLELYIRLLSKLGPEGVGSTSRNPLLVNKGADLLADKTVPADWWHVPGHRGCQLVNGRWVLTEQP